MAQKSSHSEVDFHSKLTLVSLPPEVLKHILSFLSTYDKVRIRCVSKTLRCVSEIPSLWESFIWLRYVPRSDVLLEHALKRFGEHIKRLHFTDYVAPSNLQLMVMLCKNVMHLSLPGLTYYDNFVTLEKTREKTREKRKRLYVWPTSMKPISNDSKENFKLSSSVKELSLSYTSISQLFDQIKQLLKQWVNLNYVPRKLNVIVIAIERKEYEHAFTSLGQHLPGDVYTLVSSLQESYLPILKSKRLMKVSELSDTAWLNICFKDFSPDVISPVVPFIQVQITDSSVTLPSMQASKYGLLGSDVNTVHLTQGNYRGKKVHKALLIDGIDEHVYIDTTVTSLTSITYFDASCCRSLCPHHLEQISLACPNLQKLDLRNNPKCLNSLQGLHSLANNCRNLQGLNLRQTYNVHNCEYDCVQLWEILCSMYLTQMSIDAQMIDIRVEVKRQKLIKMFQTYSSLQVLEMVVEEESDTRTCARTQRMHELIISDGELSLVTHFPSVVSYRLCNLPDNNCCHTLKRIFSSRSLRCLFLTTSYCLLPVPISLKDHCSCLQQLYINSSDIAVTESSVDVLCRHGGLEHVILSVKSISARSISHIIEYSFNLVTFGVFLYWKEGSVSFEFAFTNSEVQELIAIMKTKFSKRRLFNGGTFVFNLGNLVANHSLVLNTDLFSVWDSNHLY